MSKEMVLAMINKLEDWLRNGLEIIGEFKKTLEETPEEVIKHPEAKTLTRKNRLYGRIFEKDKKLIVFPVESLGIQASDPAITRFLEPKILEKMKEKHGVSYRLEKAQDGKTLRAIVVEGEGYDKEKFLGACGWALEKAANRQ